MKVYVLIQDYGYDGLDVRGVFSTEEKAKAASFGLFNTAIIKVAIDERIDEWRKHLV